MLTDLQRFTLLLTCLAVVILLRLFSADVIAETYSWTDDEGGYHFTDNPSSIPRKYKKKVKSRDTGLNNPPLSLSAKDTSAGVKSAADAAGRESKTSVPVQQGQQLNGLYAGKRPEMWQSDFRSREAEYKKYEKQLNDLASLSKNPAGVSRERLSGIPAEFKEVQKKYNEALKRYNELNDEANTAGLPAEFRK